MGFWEASLRFLWLGVRLSWAGFRKRGTVPMCDEDAEALYVIRDHLRQPGVFVDEDTLKWIEGLISNYEEVRRREVQRELGGE